MWKKTLLTLTLALVLVLGLVGLTQGLELDYRPSPVTSIEHALLDSLNVDQHIRVIGFIECDSLDVNVVVIDTLIVIRIEVTDKLLADTLAANADPQITVLDPMVFNSDITVKGNTYLGDAVTDSVVFRTTIIDLVNDARTQFGTSVTDTVQVAGPVFFDSDISVIGYATCDSLDARIGIFDSTVVIAIEATDKVKADSLTSSSDPQITVLDDVVFDSTLTIKGTLNAGSGWNDIIVLPNNAALNFSSAGTGGLNIMGPAEATVYFGIYADAGLDGSGSWAPDIGLQADYTNDLAIFDSWSATATRLQNRTGPIQFLTHGNDAAQIRMTIDSGGVDIVDNLTAGDIIIDEAAGVLDFTGVTSATISASGSGKVTIVAGDTLDVDMIYSSTNLELIPTGDVLVKADITFDAATYNIGALTNHVDTLFVSNIQPASVLAILDSVAITGNLSATTIGGITEANLLDKTAPETVTEHWTFGDSVTDTLSIVGTLIDLADNDVTVFGGAVTDTVSFTGPVEVSEYIYHSGDTDTNLRFEDDLLTVTVGNEALITLTEDGTQDIVKLGDGGDVDINLASGTDKALFVQGNDGHVSIGNVTPSAFYKLLVSDVSDGGGIGLRRGAAVGGGLSLENSDITKVGVLGIAGANHNFFLGTAIDDIVLYNTQAKALIFGTSNVEAMRVGSTGHFAIGNAIAPCLFSASSATPQFGIWDEDLETPTTFATIDTAAFTIDASGEPVLAFYATDGKTWNISINTSDQAVLTGASGGLLLANDILFNAATFNIGTPTNHVDTLFVSTIQPASVLAILDSLNVEGMVTITGGAVFLNEITTPTALADHGAFYTKTDDKPYFQDGDGNEHEVVTTSAYYAEMYLNANGNPMTIETAGTPIAARQYTTGNLANWTFNAGSTGAITEYVTAAAGDSTKIVSAAHGLSTGDIISLRGTANYKGIIAVTVFHADTLMISTDFVADDGASDWDEGSYLLAGTGAAGTYSVIWNLSTTEAGGAGSTLKGGIYVNATACPECLDSRKFPNNDQGSWGSSSIATVSDGDRIFMTVTSTGTNAITNQYGNVNIHRL